MAPIMRFGNGAESAQARRWILFAILVAGSLLRFSRLGQESIWADEFHSLIDATQPTWAAVCQSTWIQGVQAFYFLVLHAFTRLAGTSDIALRFPSAVFGVMAIFFFYRLARALVPRRPGFALAGAALLAISPMHVWYSQEARPYALQVLVEIMALWALVRGWRTEEGQTGGPGIRSQGWLSLAAGLVVLDLEIHNFSIFVWFTVVLIIPLAAWRNGGTRWKHLIGPGTILVVGVIHPLLSILDRLGPRSALQEFIPPAYSPWVFVDVFRAQFLGPHWSMLPMWAQSIGLLLGLGFLLSGMVALYQLRADRIPAGALSALGWGITLVVPTLISLVHPIIFYGQRYLIIAIPFTILLLAGNVLWSMERRNRWTACGALLLGSAFLVLQCAYYPPYYAYLQKHPWDLVGDYLARHTTPEDRIYVAPDRNIGLLARAIGVPRKVEGLKTNGEEWLKKAKEPGKRSRIFLVCYQDLRPWLNAEHLPIAQKNILFETHAPGQTLWVHELSLP